MMHRLSFLFLLLFTAHAGAEIPEPFDTQSGSTVPMPPSEAAVQMELPDGFHATVFASEPDVRQPISMALDSRGRLWVAECYTYAEASVGYAMQLRDRLVIFEDVDGDGHFDKRTIFCEGLQRLTSVEVGFGGVWVTAPPNVLFISDRDGDDRPDGEPEIRLDGFDFERARHTMVNGLRWGPDGWLYGRHGILGTSQVGAPGTPAEQRTTVNVGIWRYHPTRRSFEVVCDGTTNPWGLDWNEYGDAFFINTVIGHLWQAIPGAHFTRMFGDDRNPHVYQLIDQHADHVHWDTREKWSDVRELGVTSSSSKAGGGHAHTGLMFYNGGSWPEEYRGKLFTINFHGRRLNVENVVRTGSGYVGKHTPDFAQQADPWFRGIDLLTAPDGSVYLSDWSDTGECHDDDGINRQSGRIYKITYGQAAKPVVSDVAKVSNAELLPLLRSDNEWFARAARKQLQERAARGVELGEQHESLRQMFAESSDPVVALRALWALHAVGAADAAFLRTQLRHSNEYVRAWAIRLLLDDPAAATAETHAALAGLANGEVSAYVRLALASALQRVPLGKRAAIAQPLLAHAEDAGDHNLPLMLWYGIEPLAEQTPEVLLTLIESTEISTPRRLIARRLGEDVERRPVPLNDLLALAATKPASFQQDVLSGLSEALDGWRSAPKPAAWDAASDQFAKVDEARVRELAGVFGDGRALEKLRALALDATAENPVRRAALSSLIAARADGLRELCEQLFEVLDLAGTAAGGLALNDDPAIADQMLARFPGLPPVEKSPVMTALLTRPSWASKLLDAIAAGRISRIDLTAFHARQINGFHNSALDAKLTEVWGASRESSDDKTALIATWKKRLTPESLARADKRRGKMLFSQVCASCHRLYGEGGNIGPDLTGSGRADLDYLLHNIADPSALVAADYQLSSLTMVDGRVLSGMIRSRNDSIIVLQTLTETLNLQVSDVAGSETSPISIMPEGLLGAFDETKTRDLIAYLMSKEPLPNETGIGFWSSQDIAGDPLFFIQADGAPAAKAELLFIPKAAPDLSSASGEQVYELGRDFTWAPGSREIVLTEGARIPFKTVAELHPAPGAPNSYDGFRNTNLHMLYAQGRFFHDLQSVATYTASEPWPGPVPVAQSHQLSHLHARLAAHDPVKVVVLGDSISTGLNASATGDVAPHQPGYPELVTSGLAERFGTKVTLKNLSVSGMDAAWGLTQMEAAIAEKPDVFICAFGMNDASGLVPPEKFGATIRQMMDQLHAATPDCDVILVSPMTANPEWKHAQPPFYPAYAKALKELAGPGCAVADVTSVWLALLERKGVLDLSGNGLNHPNDFGHRVYAGVVLATIGAAPSQKR
ncbi:MAG: GDSL-type esterase/lipase family protein [Verrucomicrobiales bacterium]